MRINFITNISFMQMPEDTKTKKIFGRFSPVKDAGCADIVEFGHNVINSAMVKMREVKFSDEDIKKISRFGAKPVFKDGKEAIKYAKENNISIVFGAVDLPDVHAQWVNDKRTVVINERYKNTKDEAEIFAISAAIFHELAHSKDNDGISSIQEEIDCLSMNALAFNYYMKKYPRLFKNTSSPIIDDGVALYAKLFMGNDTDALKTRVFSKYGNLPVSSPNHPACDFAIEVSNMKTT